jgi:ankyrin repeat protein
MAEGLVVAAARGHAARLRALLRTADPNAANERGHLPLHWATSNDHTACVLVLLDARAAPDALDGDGQTALSRAAGRGFPHLVELLLAHKADPNAGTTRPLAWAAGRNALRSMRLLLAAGAELEAAAPETALARACIGENIEAVRLLLEHKANALAVLGCGSPLLHWCCRYRDARMVTALLRSLTPANYRVALAARDHEGHSMWACASDSVREALRAEQRRRK